MLPMTIDKIEDGKINGNVNMDLKPSGEPSSVKIGRWVRRGPLGKVSTQIRG